MKRISFVLSIALLAAVGCTQELKESFNSSDEIAIAPLSENGAVATRGYVEESIFQETPLADIHKSMMGKAPVSRDMQISAFLYPQDGTARNYFVDKTYSEGEDHLWHNMKDGELNPIYWPVGGKLEFLAFSVSAETEGPGASKNVSVAWNKENAASQVVLGVPAENTQNDILYASTSAREAKNTYEAVNMTFNHAQAWLQFALTGSLDGEESRIVHLQKIELVNAFNAGTLTISNNGGNALAQWDFTGEEAQNIPVDNFNNVSALSDEVQYLDMLIPQQCKTDFVIYYTLGTDSQVLQYRFATDQKSWLMGEKYIYNINITTSEITVSPVVNKWNEIGFTPDSEQGYKFTVTGNSTPLTYEGGVKEYTIASTNTVGDDTEGVAWKLQYKDGEEWVDAQAGVKINDWVSFDVVSGDGKSLEPATVKATVDAAEETVWAEGANVISDVLEDNSEDKPYNLAMHDIFGNENVNGETVANCYVVSKAGWYAFPLFYGNSLVDGSEVNASFAPGGETSDKYLAKFKNGKGRYIANSRIDFDIMENPIGDDSLVEGWEAVVLWQDVPYDGLINNAENCYIIPATKAVERSLAPSRASGWVVFKVDEKSLAQSNAVIAVKYKDTIVWSWHIWAYPSSELSVSPNKHILSANIGWVDEGTTKYHKGYMGESLNIRFVQDRGVEVPEIKEMEIARSEQKETKESVGGSSPLFQWGRKDPFMRSKGYSANEISDKSGEGVTKKENVNTDIAYAINNPSHFVTNYSSPGHWIWCPNEVGNYDNLWNSKEGDGYVKSIFDPSPVGFRVTSIDDIYDSTSGLVTLDGVEFPFATYRKMDVCDLSMYLEGETPRPFGIYWLNSVWGTGTTTQGNTFTIYQGGDHKFVNGWKSAGYCVKAVKME